MNNKNEPILRYEIIEDGKVTDCHRYIVDNFSITSKGGHKVQSRVSEENYLNYYDYLFLPSGSPYESPSLLKTIKDIQYYFKVYDTLLIDQTRLEALNIMKDEMIQKSFEETTLIKKRKKDRDEDENENKNKNKNKNETKDEKRKRKQKLRRKTIRGLNPLCLEFEKDFSGIFKRLNTEYESRISTNTQRLNLSTEITLKDSSTNHKLSHAVYLLAKFFQIDGVLQIDDLCNFFNLCHFLSKTDQSLHLDFLEQNSLYETRINDCDTDIDGNTYWSIFNKKIRSRNKKHRK